jgi:hypothetical protein
VFCYIITKKQYIPPENANQPRREAASVGIAQWRVSRPSMKTMGFQPIEEDGTA